jgi:opacity protein-like surface antigen
MTRFALFGAALLATALASPALAQAVVEDPGYCAQYYPNANCQNYGPGNPLYPGNGWSQGYSQGYVQADPQGYPQGYPVGYARMHGRHAWHHHHHR